MKEYMSNVQLIDYLISKKVNVINKEEAIKKIEKYTYYSIVNSYKFNFKDSKNNYLPNVSFDEIYALFEFDKNLKYIILKYTLEIETIIKSLMANQISKNYGLVNYLTIDNLDTKSPVETKEKLINKINEEINHNYNIHSAITHYKDKYGYIPPICINENINFWSY